MKRLIFSLLLILMVAPGWADYTDVPFTLSTSGTFSYTADSGTYTFSTKTGYYQEWDHYVIFWSTGYGKQSGTPTSIGSGNYLLNLTQMEEYAEKCFDSYTALGFLDPTSSSGGGHKIIILAYYTTEWEATGSGDGNYGILNISHSSANPSAVNPYWTYCHEIAHAYQYLGYMKNGGNAGFQYGDYYGYVSYYECCGNWQAAQIYNDLYFPQSMNLYNKTTNLGFVHQWHCYQSYIFNDYLTEKRGQTTIGDIWTINTNTKYADPLEKYMSKTGESAEDVYRDIFYAAMRTVTWDLDRWDTYLKATGVSRDKYMDHRMGTKASTNSSTSTPNTYNDNCWQTQSTYQYVTTNSGSAIHQVAYSSAPQSTGFNIIKLNVPTSTTNRTVTTTFTALAPGASLASGDNKEYWMGSMWATNSSQSKYNSGATSQCNSSYATYKTWRGFRLGYVAYKKSGEVRYYNYTDKVYCTGTSETSANLSFDVPDDVDSLYFVVSPALSSYLRMGSVDPYSISSDAGFVSAQQSFDQWPYRVQFYNTNIYGLSNPSTSFSGTADSGTTWTTMPDLSDGEEYGATETTYTIKTASGSPSGAGFTVSSSLTSIGNNQYTTKATITSDNATNYITPTSVEGYRASITVSGTAITITYTAVPSTTYTISVASGSPTGAGFTVSSALTLVSGSSYKTYDEITSSNVSSYVTANAVDGYTSAITVSGTTITITYTEKPSQLTITRNLTFPTSTGYSGTTYTLSSSDLTAITTALGCTSTALKTSSNWETADSYTATAPSSGKFALYAIDPTTGDYDANTTANGWGYWMDENGDVIDYGDGCAYFMEYTETTGLFTIGQYPSALSTGNTAPLKFALAYTSTSGVTTYVNIVFNCTIATTTATKYAYTIATASGSPTGAGFTTTLTKNSTFGNYESSTEITSSNVSSYVTPTAVSGYTTSLSVSGSEIKVVYTKNAGPTDPTASFATSTKNIEVGETYTQTVTTNSTGTATYSSSDTSIATVDTSTGKVTAVSPGTATITATIAATTSYNKATATYTVTVTRGTQTVNFTNASATVEKGSTVTNVARTTGDGTITYTSSDSNVATVDNKGVVTGVAQGTATITATAAQTTKYTSATATYTVTVTDNSLNEALKALIAEAQSLYTDDQLTAAQTASKSVVGDGLITASSQFSSPYTETSEGSFDYLLDKDQSTFWHSAWSNGSVAAGTHYFVVTLNEAESDSILLSMGRRSNATDDHVTQFVVYGSNDNSTWTKITTLDFAFGSQTETVTARFDLGASYTYLKFVCTNTGSTSSSFTTRGYFHMGEFQLYRITVSITEHQKNLLTLVDAIETAQSVTSATQNDIDALQAAIDAYAIVGDVNLDGKVDIADVAALVSIIQGTWDTTKPHGITDINGDTYLTTDDVDKLADIILTKK